MEAGEISAADRSAALSVLRERGLTPIELSDHVATANGRSGFLGWLPVVQPLFSGAAQAALFRDLSTLLSAGINAERALGLLSSMTSSPFIKGAVGRWLADLRAGRSLSAAMAQDPTLAPPHVARVLAAAEASGQLSVAMHRIAGALASAKATRDRVIAALAYPALLILVTVALLGFLLTSVIPNLEPLFRIGGAEIPWSTQLLVSTSRGIADYGWAMLFALALAATIAWAYVSSAAGRAALSRYLWRGRLFLGIPAKRAAADFGRTLGMLLDGGVTISDAMDIARRAVGNKHFQALLTAASARVRQGEPLRKALSSIDGAPVLLVEMAGLGDETGRHGHALAQCADILDQDVQIALDRATALILPVMTVLIGIFVAFIMAGIVSGMLAANDAAI